MTHSELWGGIRNLAARYNLSCSGLAKLSGLDSTIFNKSKSYTKDGQPRWISMSSLSRVLDATGISLAEFATYLPSDTHMRPSKISKIKHKNMIHCQKYL